MEANQVVDLLHSLGADRIQVVGKKVTATCPVHQERNPSFAVWWEDGTYCCLACGAKGTLPKLVKEVLGCAWSDAVLYVRRFGEYEMGAIQRGTIPEFSKRFRDTGLSVLPQTTLDGFASPNWRMLNYLSLRGVTRRTAVRAKLLRFAEDSRVLFVWYDGDIARGMTSRSYLLETDPHRGKPLLGFAKGSHVYRADACCYAGTLPCLYVCEGEISALRLQSAGYPACALSGWKMSDAQARKIATMAKKAVLMFDNDTEGGRGVVEATRMLAPLLPTFVPAELPDTYVDPADCPLDVLHRIVNGSMRLC